VNDGPLTIECKHGTLAAAVVCRHHGEAQERVVGFVENSADPDDLQAWCDECEALYLREDGLTEEFRHFNAFAAVCIVCYAELKARHTRSG
jgi:hypothetical protein